MSHKELIGELDNLVALAKQATPGEWFGPHLSHDDADCSCNCGYIFSEGQRGMGAICEVFSDLKGNEEEEQLSVAKANGQLIAASVNFVRKHGRYMSTRLTAWEPSEYNSEPWNSDGKECDCGCNDGFGTDDPLEVLRFLSDRFKLAGVGVAVAHSYARSIDVLLSRLDKKDTP